MMGRIAFSNSKEEVGLVKTTLAMLATVGAILMGAASAMPLGKISLLDHSDLTAQHVRVVCNQCRRCYSTRHYCTRRYVRRYYGVRPNAGYGPGYCGYGPNQQGCAPSYF
jgi:hypothetical protein